MTYPGGKNGAGVFQKIINLMPPHQVYIEPFLGSGAILRLKKPAALNIGVDLERHPIFGGELRATSTTTRFGDGVFRFERRDALEFLKAYPFDGTELVYCDPPYLHETRKQKKLYRFEMSDAQHQELLRILCQLPARVMISGYTSPMYRAALATWNTISYQTMTRSGKPATETLWFNFPEPVALHDYRYLGETFRDRERIKRKKLRWIHRLEIMPALERRALLAAIELTSPDAAI
jgi:DNA adenine methylase